MKKDKQTDKKGSIKKISGIRNVHGQPETAFDMLNKYGTYEIQPTSDSGNEFPQISQGIPKNIKNNK